MPTLVENGHDISGTTALRPTNVEFGQVYFDTTLQKMLVYGAGGWQDMTNAGNATSAASPGSNSVVRAGDGFVGTGTTPGSAGGNETVRGGTGGAKTGTGAAAGGAGGSITEMGGTGGATASSGTDAGGAGGAANVTGGTGGAATAGTGNGGAGGSVVLTPGTGGTSAGGAPGAQGTISVAGPISSPVTAAQTIANGNTITLPTTGKNKHLTNAGAVTGNILPAGRFDGDEIDLINISANTITFAASGTSRVANGTSAVIAALGKMKLIWSTTQALWY